MGGAKIKKGSVEWGGESMAKKAKKVEPRYAVNISMKAWDIAKAGAAVKLRVRNRTGLLGTIEIGQGTLLEERARLEIQANLLGSARGQA
jgi:hypothetical protein